MLVVGKGSLIGELDGGERGALEQDSKYRKLVGFELELLQIGDSYSLGSPWTFFPY
jgi:hypothetical protein